MKTENVLSTTTVARAGVLSVVRVVDFEKIAAASEDGRIGIEALRDGGDFNVKFQPIGRDADAIFFEASSAEDAATFVRGFCAFNDTRARAPRGDSDWDASSVKLRGDLEGLTKPQLCSVANLHKVAFKANDNKGVIAKACAKVLPAK